MKRIFVSNYETRLLETRFHLEIAFSNTFSSRTRLFKHIFFFRIGRLKHVSGSFLRKEDNSSWLHCNWDLEKQETKTMAKNVILNDGKKCQASLTKSIASKKSWQWTKFNMTRISLRETYTFFNNHNCSLSFCKQNSMFWLLNFHAKWFLFDIFLIDYFDYRCTQHGSCMEVKLCYRYRWQWCND